MSTSIPNHETQLSNYVTQFSSYCDEINNFVNQEKKSLEMRINEISSRTPKTPKSCFSCLLPKKSHQYDHVESSSDRIEFRKFLQAQLNDYEKIYKTAQQIANFSEQLLEHSSPIEDIHSNFEDLHEASMKNCHSRQDRYQKNLSKKTLEKLEPLQNCFHLAYGRISQRKQITNRNISSFLNNLEKLNARMDVAYKALKNTEFNPSSRCSKRTFYPIRVFFVNGHPEHNLHSSSYPHLQEALDSPHPDDDEKKEESVAETSKSPIEEAMENMAKAKKTLQTILEQMQVEAFNSMRNTDLPTTQNDQPVSSTEENPENSGQ